MQSTKFNTSMATVGNVNQNGIVMFGKNCHLPRAVRALICTMIKRATGARVRQPYISVSKLSFWRTRTVGSQRKKLQAIKLLANIGSLIAKDHQLN